MRHLFASILAVSCLITATAMEVCQAQSKAFQDKVDDEYEARKAAEEKLPRDTAAEALLFRIARLLEIHARSHGSFPACTGIECAETLDAKELKSKLIAMPVSVRLQENGKRFIATVRGKDPVGLLMWDSKEPGVQVIE